MKLMILEKIWFAHRDVVVVPPAHAQRVFTQAPATMTKIDRHTTALIVTDMQRDFLDPGGYAAAAGLDVTLLRGAIPGVKRLLTAARSAGIVVVHTRECNSPDLSDVPPAFADATIRSGAPVGHPGPLGRLLVRGEPGVGIIDGCSPILGEIVIDKPGF